MANSVSAGGPGWARPAAILSVGYDRKVELCLDHLFTWPDLLN